MEPQIYNAEYTIHVAGADIKFYQMVYSPKKLYTVNHVHSHFELHYITEGNAVYTMNFHDEITLEKGDWLLINRNVYHEETEPVTDAQTENGVEQTTADERETTDPNTGKKGCRSAVCGSALWIAAVSVALPMILKKK